MPNPPRDAAFIGPHQAMAHEGPQEQFVARLFDALWDRYRQRVAHVAAYERVIRNAGAMFVNDHVAFRTLAVQKPLAGIASVSRVFEALGYRSAGCYNFPDKHLSAIHYQHANRGFPKLFISELKTWELGRDAREAVERTLASHRDPIDAPTLATLESLDGAPDDAALFDEVVRQFHDLPWQPPDAGDVETVNAESQYAAWVLVHGYNVNHFTSLINSHGVEALDDIEKTIAALRKAGVPMKAEIEGERGSKLRQSATEAAVIDVNVLRGGSPDRMPWTYAYFELAERGEVTDPETGRPARFEGFLGPQATQLFEMTRVARS